jgi:hypothetical protein
MLAYYSCMWAGGPIGKKNKRSFFFFLCFLYPTLIMDAYLLINLWRHGKPVVAVDDDTL